MTNKMQKRITLPIDEDSQYLIGTINTALMSIGYGVDDWLADDTAVDVIDSGYSNRCAIEVRDDLDIEYFVQSLEGAPILMVMSKEKGLGIEIEVSEHVAETLNEMIVQFA